MQEAGSRDEPIQINAHLVRQSISKVMSRGSHAALSHGTYRPVPMADYSCYLYLNCWERGHVGRVNLIAIVEYGPAQWLLFLAIARALQARGRAKTRRRKL